uniref:Uncharacterized protein n=1 Tax=Plectus sambesii TaxID=2011161 RepID=A0A914WWI4_9BILA
MTTGPPARGHRIRRRGRTSRHPTPRYAADQPGSNHRYDQAPTNGSTCQLTTQWTRNARNGQRNEQRNGQPRPPLVVVILQSWSSSGSARNPASTCTRVVDVAGALCSPPLQTIDRLLVLVSLLRLSS